MRGRVKADWLTAHGPSGDAYTIAVHPAGVPDVVPGGGAVPEVLLGWIWHGIRHRGEWQVRLHKGLRLRDLTRTPGFPPWAIIGSGSRAEARELAQRTKRQVEAGELQLTE